MRAEVRIFGLEEMNERVKRLENVIASLTKQSPEQFWFDVNESATYLGISPRSIRRLVKRGLIKKSLGIRQILIHREDLEKYRQNTTI
jgi:excisionase family DNA binding protein